MRFPRLTDEVNATIQGVRTADARAFVVNEGHGGNRFAKRIAWMIDRIEGIVLP